MTGRRLRIAQVAPLYERVPPVLYGGTERVVSYLTEELVRRGHDVTLFASGDSCTTATLVPVVERATRLDASTYDMCSADAVRQLDMVLARAGDFDVIPYRVDSLAFPSTHMIATPSVNTRHGRLDRPPLR